MTAFVHISQIEWLKKGLESVCQAASSIQFTPVNEGVASASETIHPRRLEERRQARLALGRVIQDLGDPTEPPDNMKFPHRRFSISHSTGVAVACGVGSQSRARGIGIDVERLREVSDRLGRFFLREEETKALGKVSGEQVLRLWTIKEAVFKADPHNHERVLRHYRVGPLGQSSGNATHVDTGAQFWFASVPLERGGWLTIAAGI